MKKIFTMFFSFMLMFFLTATGYTETATVVLNDYPPFSWVANNTSQGTNYDIITAAFKAAGVEPKISIEPVSRGANSFKTRETRFFVTSPQAAKSNGIAEEKTEFLPICDVVFTFGYFKSHQKKPIDWKTFDDLKQYRIGYIQGDGAVAMLEGKGLKLDVSTTLDAGLKKLMEKRIDLLLGIDSSMHFILHKTHPNLNNDLVETNKYLFFVPGGFYYWKDDTEAKKLIEKYKTGWGIIKKNGTSMQILKKYYGENVPKGILKTYHY